MESLEVESDNWDKKKIVISIIVLIISIGVFIKLRPLILGSSNEKVVSKKIEGFVEGASTKEESSDLPKVSVPNVSFSKSTIQNATQEKLNNIKSQVENLDIQEIASSSPQVQKVINDLKSLQNYPKDQAKQMCENICKNL